MDTENRSTALPTARQTARAYFGGLDHLLLFGTTTPWKLAEYDGIARSLRADTAIRIAVEPVNKYVNHHAAVEDGVTGTDNASLKWDDIAHDFARLREGRDLHRSFRHRLARQGVSFRDGRLFAADRITGLTDDSTTFLPARLWHYLQPELQKRVVPDALKTSGRVIDGADYVCVTDIGPITSAIGTTQFWNLTRRAALRAGYDREPVPVIIQASCAFNSLSDKEGAQRGRLEREAMFHLFAPDGLAVPVQHDGVAIPTAEHFLAHPGNPRHTVAENYGAHLPVTSVRRAVIAQFLQHIGLDADSNQNVLQFPDQTPLNRRQVKRHEGRIRLVQPTVSKRTGQQASSKKLGNYNITKRAVDPAGGFNETVFLNAMSMEFDFARQQAQHADALILAPFDSANPAHRIYNAAIFQAAIDAKVLDPRYQEVPVVVLNLNGCWNDIIRSHLAYARNGFSKEFVRHPAHDGKDHAAMPVVTQPGVRHLPLHFVNILSGAKERPLYAAAQQIFDQRLAPYHRTGDIMRGTQEGGVAKPAGLFTLTTIGSASSDRLTINRDAMLSGNIAARNGWGYVTGGGDQHVMGAMIDGYARPPGGHKGPWLAGISTHNIVKVETRSGHIPRECDYWALSDLITPRLVKLTDLADSFVSLGGGNGTGHEGAVILAQRMLFPTPARLQKSIVFIGHDDAKLSELNSFIGSKKLRRLRRDGDALHAEGIHLRPDMQSAEPLLREFKASFDRRNAAKPPRMLKAG